MEKLMADKGKSKRGGARIGAGRPRTAEPRKAHSFSCTDTEAEAIKKILAFWRAYPDLIDNYCNKLLPKASDKHELKAPSLQWLESEDEQHINMTNISNSAKKKNFQWLESEAEEEASSNELAQRINRSVDVIAKGIAEILVK